MAIGDFDTGDFNFTTWMFFLAASIIELTILLNLLIAIISDSFAEVQQNAIVYAFRERA